MLAAAGGAGGADVRIVTLPPDLEAWEKWSGPFWVCLEANAAATARLAVGCPEETRQALAQWIGGEGLDDAATRQAYSGLVQHATESLAQAAAERIKRPLVFAEPAECSLPAYATLGVGCHFSLGGEAHTVALVPNEVSAGDAAVGGNRLDRSAENRRHWRNSLPTPKSFPSWRSALMPGKTSRCCSMSTSS